MSHVRSQLKSRLQLVLKGFCMGAADVVPGVSGGTMAFILGIYPRLIEAIRSFDLVWLRMLLRFDIAASCKQAHFAFLLPLLSGIILALLFFTRVISLPELILNYPELIYGLFCGLILGSIVILLQESGIRSIKDVVFLVAGAVVGLFIVTLVPVSTPEANWFIFLSGAIAICAMILPGISGSFILLLMKKYAYIFDAIGHFKFDVIIAFGLGAVTGLLLFSRLLSWLLHVAYHATLLVITGFLIASLWLLWPFQTRVFETIRGKQRLIESTPVFPNSLDETVVFSLLLVLTGVCMVLTMHWFAQKRSN